MSGLLDALLKNESGGRNVANTTQGTSSGQAQGYFQITTGTWNDFGGQQFAPTPLQATYDQQAAIAAKIPLKRWDESTVAMMKATGKPIDTNRTLGENLTANGESFGTGPTTQTQTQTAAATLGPNLSAGANDQPLLPEATDPFTPLSKTLAENVGTTPARRSPGRDAFDAGSAAPPAPPFEYASATPESPPLAALPSPAAEPSGPSPLADLFKVKPIGLTGTIDPLTGQPKLPTAKRMYG
jgi:hypothetical protein